MFGTNCTYLYNKAEPGSQYDLNGTGFTTIQLNQTFYSVESINLSTSEDASSIDIWKFNLSINGVTLINFQDSNPSGTCTGGTGTTIRQLFNDTYNFPLGFNEILIYSTGHPTQCPSSTTLRHNIRELYISGSHTYNFMPEFNLSLQNISQFCINENTGLATAKLDLNISDVENDNLLYDYTCSYSNIAENIYLHDLDNPDYNLWLQGWNNGSCEYQVKDISGLTGNVLFLNNSGCISNLDHYFSEEPINQNMVLEFNLGVFQDDVMQIDLFDTGLSLLTGLQVNVSGSENRVYIEVYNGSDYLKFYNFTDTLFNDWFKLDFNFAQQSLNLSISTDWKESYNLIGNFVFNETNLDLIRFNTLAPYTWYPSYLGTIFYYYPSFYVEYESLALSDSLITCQYSVLGSHEVRVYITDTVHNTSYPYKQAYPVILSSSNTFCGKSSESISESTTIEKTWFLFNFFKLTLGSGIKSFLQQDFLNTGINMYSVFFSILGFFFILEFIGILLIGLGFKTAFLAIGIEGMFISFLLSSTAWLVTYTILFAVGLAMTFSMSVTGREHGGHN